MRASRLMSILFLLQQRRGTTAAALAEELEVSVRTIYRDIAALQAAGVPLWAEPGPGGGIRLVDGWRTRLDGLTGDEAAALFLAGAPTAVSDLGLGAVLTAAESKVIATLPPELRGRAGRLRERFHLDAPGWFGQEETPEHLATVADAVWSGRRLDITYRRGEREVERRLSPLGLVLKAGTWYLVAGLEDQTRTYRLGRIASATTRDEPVVRPPGFDLASWWAASAAEFDRSLLRFTCRVRLSPHAFRFLRHYVSVASYQAAAASAGPPDDDGWREVTLPTEGENVAATQLICLAPGVEVLEPSSLRESLRDVGRRLAERNGARPAGMDAPQ
ncbi:helix-turn-helix transcriptional regulator [Phytoactinopolyspora halotolerans]|uniref:YafY family transcriptional regulator n=1 Tax=Phytoactinopolyspora halotolerans TaxID=1981512 RepID=A0A6L9S2N4_9ACTN|nr:YafY family protein [Phytoactinopolyspora halotolerans]NED99316.1 YafY family transcriptional regulator [Phytoactinopolyspora halotolerans]